MESDLDSHADKRSHNDAKFEAHRIYLQFINIFSNQILLLTIIHNSKLPLTFRSTLTSSIPSLARNCSSFLYSLLNKHENLSSGVILA